MKFKIFHYFKYLVLFAFFFLLSLQSFSKDKIQKVNQLKEIKSIKVLRAQFKYFHKEVYSPNNDIENIEEWISYFENEKRKYQSNKDIAYINFILVYLYKTEYDLDKAIDIGLTTYYLKFEIDKKNKFLCELLSIVEWCYHIKDNNLELIRINKEKFKVCDKEAVNYHSAYFNMGLFDLALKSYKEYINYNSPSYKKNDLYQKAYHYNDFGVYYMYDNKIDSALYYYNKSISLFEEQDKNDISYKRGDTEFMLSIVKGNIGTCLLKKKQYKKAIPLYLDEIKASNIYYRGRNWLGSEKVYHRIAICYIRTNQFEKAKVYINKLIKNIDLYYNIKSEYHNQLQNKDSTIYFKNKYIATKDSIFRQKLMQKDIESLNALDFNDKIQKQEAQINLLEQKDSNKSFQVRFFLLISIVIIILFFSLLYFYFDKIKKQNIVESQKNEIESALNNNKTLLKELNHRVKNNLQMVSSVISLQASKIKDENSKKHFKSAVNRIKVLSQIHNSLYTKNQLDEIDLLNYVIVLKDYLMNSIINPDVKVAYQIDISNDLYINNDKKTTIGLIINELITNSLKYAFNEKGDHLITISILKKENYFYFIYKDNGKGFNYKLVDKSKSIGLNLILRLVNQLGEEAEIISENGMQMSFKLYENIN